MTGWPCAVAKFVQTATVKLAGQLDALMGEDNGRCGDEKIWNRVKKVLSVFEVF